MTGAGVRAVRVRPGDGRLCRTPVGVVFAPEVADGWDEVVAAAMTTVEGDLVATVAAVLSRLELDAPGLVVIAWRPRLAVLVFGDVELRSDHPAVPLLSGRGSRTWVEHSLPGGVEEFQLSVQPPDAGDDTDLWGGVVPAGGLCVEMSGAAGTDVPPIARTVASPVGRTTASPVEPPVAPAVASPVEPAVAPAVASPVEPAVAPPVAPSSGPQSTVGPSVTPPPPAPSGAAAQPPSAPSPSPSRTLVDAVRCTGGHHSPPGSSSCRDCGALLPPNAPIEAVPRPPIGLLVFDDGVEVVLEADLVLGRRPPDDGRATYAVEGDRVSRHHAELRVVGWDVHLYDPGSRNGTYVVTPGGTEPSRIEVDVPTRLESGSRVYLGTRSFTFRGLSATP